MSHETNLGPGGALFLSRTAEIAVDLAFGLIRRDPFQIPPYQADWSPAARHNVEMRATERAARRIEREERQKPILDPYRGGRPC